MLLTGGLITKETALKKAPYVDNPEEEFKKITDEVPDVYRIDGDNSDTEANSGGV